MIKLQKKKKRERDREIQALARLLVVQQKARGGAK